MGERLYPDDLFIMYVGDEAHCFNQAGRSTAVTSLEREEPGPFQEGDIAVMMGRVFDGKNIYLNPLRADTGRELTDVLVVNDHVMLFIQAKDSPNTEAMLHRSIERKRATIRSHVRKAADQLRGALMYARENDGVTVQTAAVPVIIPIAGRKLLGLVVVQELFHDDLAACSIPVLEVVRHLKAPAVLLDYSGLHTMTQNLRTPDRLINGFLNMLGVALEREAFPKPAWY